MYSKNADYHYDIQVYVPNVDTPENGFPVLFVLDGQRYSDIIFNVMKNQIRMSEKTKVKPMIIVSIGHQDNDFVNRRFYDFTAPSHSYIFPVRRGKHMEPKPVGNALNFKNFIQYELIPFIEQQHSIDKEKFYLYGHSLGGLFSLWVYLTDTKLFSKYIAVSPSIWWNNYELLNILQKAENISPSDFAIYVGGEEGDMVEDALTFFNHRKCANKNTEIFIALNENHASVVPTTISKALRFLSV